MHHEQVVIPRLAVVRGSAALGSPAHFLTFDSLWCQQAGDASALTAAVDSVRVAGYVCLDVGLPVPSSVLQLCAVGAFALPFLLFSPSHVAVGAGAAAAAGCCL